MTTVIVCSRCRWTRTIVPASPPDLKADLESGVYQRDRLQQCPACGDVNLDVERRDLFGRVELRSL